MTTFRSLLNCQFLLGLMFFNGAWSAEMLSSQPQSFCAVANVQDVSGDGAMLFQYAFEDGTHDLAMRLSNTASDIKRVTFGGSLAPECHYKAMSLARGGDWGWHLAWVAMDAAILSYARMDGVAWVSSPTKKLSKDAHVAGQPVILTFEQKVWIVWIEADGGLNKIYAVYSGDEGRSWAEAKLLTQTSAVVGKVLLDIKAHKPYLVWGEKTEATLLPE